MIGTNNQEVGVDEADLVKSDGRRLVSVVNGTLRVVELDGTPAIDGSLDLSARGATDIFLRGDTVLVLGTTYGNAYYGGAAGGDIAIDRAAPIPTTAPMPTDPTSTTTPPEPTSSTTTTSTTRQHQHQHHDHHGGGDTTAVPGGDDAHDGVAHGSVGADGHRERRPGGFAGDRTRPGRPRQGGRAEQPESAWNSCPWRPPATTAAAVVEDLDESDLLPRIAVSGRVGSGRRVQRRDARLATATIDPTGDDTSLPSGQ